MEVGESLCRYESVSVNWKPPDLVLAVDHRRKKSHPRWICPVAVIEARDTGLSLICKSEIQSVFYSLGKHHHQELSLKRIVNIQELALPPFWHQHSDCPQEFLQSLGDDRIHIRNHTEMEELNLPKENFDLIVDVYRPKNIFHCEGIVTKLRNQILEVLVLNCQQQFLENLTSGRWSVRVVNLFRRENQRKFCTACTTAISPPVNCGVSFRWLQTCRSIMDEHLVFVIATWCRCLLNQRCSNLLLHCIGLPLGIVHEFPKRVFKFF